MNRSYFGIEFKALLLSVWGDLLGPLLLLFWVVAHDELTFLLFLAGLR
jgi:hypothetical protein